VLLLALLPLSAAAQAPKATEGDKQIEKYFAAEADRLGKRALDGATTLAEWQQRRPRLRQEYFSMLGLWPLPEKTPLHATVTAQREHDGIVVENLHFQSRSGLYVTANVYRPKEIKGKLPAILYLCGHSGRGRDGNKSAFQDHGLWFAHNGYVCLILDTLQLGEIPGIHHGTYGLRERRDKSGQAETRFWWHCRGYTPAGVECWNGVRGIDYLVSRPDVDPQRLGVTGISGGGAATFWVAAADERIKCAVPVSGMSDLESYVKHKVINGHCDCMFLYNTYQWEWTTIAALIAPRPLLFCNSDNDSIFPMDGNRRIIERLRKLYGLYGKPGLVDEYVSHGGHDYRPDLRVAVFKWLNRHLKNDTGPVEDTRYKLLPARSLRVFPEDSDIPKGVLNGKIDELFVPKGNVKFPPKKEFTQWRQRTIEELRAQCFRSFPKRLLTGRLGYAEDAHEPGGPTHFCLVSDLPVLAQTTDAQGSGVFTVLTTEPGIRIDFPHRWHDREDPRLINIGVGEDEGHASAGNPTWLAPLVNDRRVYWVYPRGRGTWNWTRKSPPNYVERAHALLGQTVDQRRVLDIVAAVRYQRSTDKKKRGCRVLGRGQAGILAAYAALFEPSIKEVVILDPPTSHMQGPYFLNVLRVLDIPEALGLLAPNVRLTLVGARDPAFDRTAEIYRLAGAADKCRRK
jgi:cephalosporin-C deacetylase-like acetyl esterase